VFVLIDVIRDGNAYSMVLRRLAGMGGALVLESSCDIS